MNTAAMKKTEIIKQLSRASEKDLERIRICIDSVLGGSSPTAQSSHSLKGIWKGKGFDQIGNLEEEVEQVRRELGDSILKREP